MIGPFIKISNLKSKLLNSLLTSVFPPPLRFGRASCLLTSIFCLLSSLALANFDFSPNCQEAQQAILDLRTKTARELLSREKGLHPDNAYVIYLEQYTDIIELLVTDEESRYERLMEIYVKRFEEMDELDDGSPYNSILQAEMLFYVGLAQIKFGSQITGAAKIYSSYRQVKAHREDYPDFFFNLKMTGMYNIMMDFIPQSMRWITGILGVGGDSEKGLQQLKEYFSFVNNTPGLAEESVLILNLAYKLTWQDEQGLEFMAGLDTSLCNNTLSNYLCAITASFAFKNELALEKLNQIDRNQLQVPFYSLDYIIGRSLLNSLAKEANKPLEKFLEEYPGKDFKKDACYRLAIYYLLQGDLTLFNEYRTMADTIGQAIRDRDLEASMECKSPILPHSSLLKARLLFDGGYFHKADSVMNTISVSTLSLKPYQLEYFYRQGRIDQMLGRGDQALLELTKAAHDGANQPFTFATRAALQLASIYEEKGEFPLALYWYKKCLDYYSNDHTVGSVEDKADKGRKRMEAML